MLSQQTHPRVVSHEHDAPVLQTELVGYVILRDLVGAKVPTEVYERRKRPRHHSLNETTVIYATSQFSQSCN